MSSARGFASFCSSCRSSSCRERHYYSIRGGCAAEIRKRRDRGPYSVDLKQPASRRTLSTPTAEG
jgi:hypothetical protein